MGFNEFIEENNITYDHEFGYFKIYSSVAVGSTDIIRTAKSFYGNEWFSNVSIFSEDSIWYGKVSINYCFFLLLTTIFYFKLFNIIDLILGTFVIKILHRKG